MTNTPDLDSVCPHCNVAVGDHTIRGYGDCLAAQGFNHHEPYTEIPDGPLMMGTGEQIMVGEINLKSGTMDTPLGRLPVLMFQFVGPGLTPMSRVFTPEYLYVGDTDLMRKTKELVDQHVDAAIARATQ